MADIRYHYDNLIDYSTATISSDGETATLPASNVSNDLLAKVARLSYDVEDAWTARSAAEANQWNSVCWSPELTLFVAVSLSGTNRVMTSPDGITWTARAATEANQWASVCWSPELTLFVAVSLDGTNQVMTSPDGITWTARSAADTSQWISVCWSPELTLFVAVAQATSGTSRVMTSPDGITWTARSAAEANQWRSVCWSPELTLFVAVGMSGTNRVMTSPDGITWTARSAAEANSWVSVCWSPELTLFVAVAASGTNRVMTSPNGTTWTTRSASEANEWRSVCWSPELTLFVAVAIDGTNRIMTSANGTTWTAQSAAEANQWLSVCWSPELALFVAVAASGTNRVMTVAAVIDIVFDLGSAKAVTSAIIASHTIAATATITLQFNSSDSWASPAATETLTYSADSIYKVFDSKTYRYARLKIANQAQADIGRVFLGTYVTATRFVDREGYTLQPVDRSETARTLGGQTYTWQRDPYKRVSLNFSQIDDTQKAQFVTLADTVGTHTPFFVFMTDMHATPIYVKLAALPAYQNAGGVSGAYLWNVALELEEQL